MESKYTTANISLLLSTLTST